MSSLTAASLLLGTILLISLAPAQDPTAPRQPIVPPPSGRILLFDGVIGVIGDKAILESTVQAELKSLIAGAGRNVPPEEIDKFRREILAKITRNEALAQGARTIGGATPERMEQVFEQIMDDYKRSEIEKAGSVNKLTQNLGVLGRTWDTIYEEERTRMMASIAGQQTLATQFRDRLALLVTPRQMRQFYDDNPALFVEKASADLAVVAFPVRGNPIAALEVAQRAATAWRTGTQTAAELAAAFPPGVDLEPRTRVRDDPRDSNSQWIKDFARAASTGDVCAPSQQGNNLWVLKVETKREGRDYRFDDPTVHQRILELLVDDEQARMQNKLIQKSMRKFKIIQPTARHLPVGRR